jgi:Cu(I)/Ag(I) efflux system membrane fusion protein
MKMPGAETETVPGMAMGLAAGKQVDSSSKMPGYMEVAISPEMQQKIGVTIGEVEKGPLKMSVRTVGIVRANETLVKHLNLKTSGWVEELFVNFTGQTVEKGAPLLAIYSPDFLTTQQDFLTSRRAQGSRGLQEAQQSLTDAALRRLELLDVPQEEIDALTKAGTPQKSLTLRSPIAGIVLEKNAFEGMHVTPEQELYVVGDLSTVWVQAKVYEYEMPHVEMGHPVKVNLPAVPETEFDGKVDFIEPTLEEASRTVRVRVELANPQGLLKPGMFAHIEIMHTMGEGLLIPTSAVLRSGERDIAFRVEKGDKNGDRFVPAEVKIDAVQFGDQFHILEGLEAGERVVTSANFLIDSESRLRAGGGGMAGMPGMEMGMPGMEKGDMKGMEGMKGMESKGKPAVDHSKMKH